MIVKFHARGVGRGSGPVDYLLGPQRDREGATLDRGDPGLIEALIDSSPYAKKYTSGVLSFQEADLPREDKDKLMDSFERALLPGLDRDQYACLWVEHRDKERLELNFVIPNIELLSGKRLQPYFDRADRPRIDAWKVVVNAQLGLHDPDDPLNKRALMTPSNLPKAKQDAAQAITDGLLSLAAAGELADRGDVVATLKQHGFEVVRETRKSISIADPEGGRNIRLKGALYEQDFRAGQDLRRELEAAGERYRNEREERVRAARESYSRGVGIKRAEIEHRYRRPEPEVGLAGVEGWVFPLIGVAFLLGISWVVVWYQGRVIAENWVEISRQNKTLEQLAAKGGKLELSTCGKDQRLCVKMDLKELAYGREEESERGEYPWRIPEGY